MNPTLSIIIPTFNRAALVRTCVESVLAMELSGAEVIVVDDGSTDETAAVLAQFASRIRYVWQTNTGPSGARNKGAAVSTGRYLAFLDSDDRWLADGPQQLLGILERYPEIDAVFADAKMGNDRTGYRSFVDAFSIQPFSALLGSEIEPGLAWCSQRALFRQMAVKNVIFPGTVFWRREVFERLGGFDPSVYVAEDWELSMRLTAECRLAYFSRGPVTVYNWHEGDRLTSNYDNMAAGYVAALESVLRKSPLAPEDRAHVEHMLSRHLAGIAHGEFVSGDLRVARQRYFEWLQRFGFNRRIFTRWVLSHAPRDVVEFVRTARHHVMGRA